MPAIITNLKTILNLQPLNYNSHHHHHHYHHQITYDVVTEEACATHSVPECATVVRQVPEQVGIIEKS